MHTAEDQHCILIVDDEPGILDSLQMLFELEGFHTVIATNGDEALACVQAHRPDLVLTDYMMPRRNGFELAQALRMDPATRTIPIVMMTAVSVPMEDVASWVDTVLIKPVTIDRMLEVILGLLEPSND